MPGIDVRGLNMNALMIKSIDWYKDLINTFKEKVPGLYVTVNYEEIKAMVKAGEIDRLCILLGGYNYSKHPWNTIQGYEAAEDLHKISKDLPILVINGSNSEVSKETGLLEYISRDKENEVYLNNDEAKMRERFFSGDLLQDFYNGLL